MPGMDLLALVCKDCQKVLAANRVHEGLDGKQCPSNVRLERFLPAGCLEESASAVYVVPLP